MLREVKPHGGHFNMAKTGHFYFALTPVFAGSEEQAERVTSELPGALPRAVIFFVGVTSRLFLDLHSIDDVKAHLIPRNTVQVK